MKPETLARRATLRRAEQVSRRANLLQRLTELADVFDGPPIENIWADLLQETKLRPVHPQGK